MIKILGDLAIDAFLAVMAGFLTQAIKGMIPDDLHRYIPIPLVLAGIGMGVLVAFLQGGDLVESGKQGALAGVLAVYGYQAIKGFVTTSGE